MKSSFKSKLVLTLLVMAAGVGAQTTGPAPPTDLIAVDHPWDGGDQLDISWTLSSDDPGNIAVYKLYRTMTEAEILKENADYRFGIFNNAKLAVTNELYAEADVLGTSHTAPDLLARIRNARKAAGDEANKQVDDNLAARAGEIRYRFLTVIQPDINSFTLEKLERGHEYGFKLVAMGKDGSESEIAELTSLVAPTRQGFDGSRFFLALIIIIVCGSVIYFINVARGGKTLKVRTIAGLQAVDEAVGRATEMGRSILFIPGIQDINDIQTIAGLTILSRVAKTAASYDAKLEVPTSRSLVMTTARETVQAAFLAAGRPDAFNQDLIYYVTDEQFGYVAYLSGMMVREKPAACFYLGAFFAESLILAETGNSIGAIQIAGTAMPAQLPFFVAACDYTLIGEEFFAASAYLSGEPDQLGSLKGQDVGKSLVGVLMAIGILFLTLATIAGYDSGFGEAMQNAAEYLKSVILT